MIVRDSEPIYTQYTNYAAYALLNIRYNGYGCKHVGSGNVFWNLWSIGSLYS